MEPVGITALFVGAWLIYATVTGQPITDSIKAALTGAPRPSKRSLSIGNPTGTPSSAGVGAGAGGGTSNVTSTGGRPSVLVPLGQGSHKLTPAAAAAFQAWQRAYGRTIPISDSYRDWDVQAAQHAKNPDRFVAPEKSAHPRGEAVDVDLSKVDLAPLLSAAAATGWCQSAANKKPLAEPWHFSFNGCR